MNAFEKIHEEMREFQKTMYQKGEDLLKLAFKEYFDKYPYVGSVSWTQYTIYFNDGDACPFRINEFQLHIRAQEGEGYVQDEGEEIDMYGGEEEDYPYVTQECYDDLSEIESGCQDIEDITRSVFGDHARIIATREGFTIEAYDDHN
jgi:hypothetical protein